MSIVSYAQNFEDVMLWRALGQVAEGFYIDVGAQHPVIDSVSKAFYEHGWRGIHVEPTTTYATLLRQDRPDETVLQAALTHAHGTLTFYEIPETGLSTADPAIAERHKQQGFDIRETTVPCLTLADVFERAGTRDIHWLKIDVEGFERQVLEGWGLSPARPWVVVVESTLPLTPADLQNELHTVWPPESCFQWESLLLDYGYDPVCFDGLNRYYVSVAKPELREAFRAGPNVIDGFQLNSVSPFCHLIQNNHQAQLTRVQVELDQTKHAAQQELVRSANALANQQELYANQERTLREQLRTAHDAMRQLESGLVDQGLANIVKEQSLVRDHTSRVESLLQQFQASQTELRQLTQEGAARERELTQQTAQIRQEVEGLLRTLAQRESEFGRERATLNEQKDNLTQKYEAKIADIRERLESKADDLAKQLEKNNARFIAHLQEVASAERSYAERLNQVRSEQAKKEQEYSHQLLILNRKNSEVRRELEIKSEHSARRESHLDHVLATINEEKAELLAHREALQREIENKGKEITAIFQQAEEDKVRLSHSLRLSKNELEKISASLSWRLTAPFRKILSMLCSADPKAEQNHDLISRANYSCEPSTPNFFQAVVQPLAANKPVVEAMPPATQATAQRNNRDSNMSTPTRLGQMSPAATLDELLAHDDASFVNCAYLTLFERESDPTGFQYYLSRLENGISKLQILAQLYTSPELRKNGASLPGLREAVAQWKRGRLPLIGRLFKPAAIGKNVSLERKLKNVENALSLLNEEVTLHFDRLDHRLTGIQQALDEIRVAAGSQHVELRTSPVAPEFLGRNNQRYLFNLSTSNHWQAHVVGIVRVERELAKYLSKYQNVEFVIWDNNANAFKSLSPQQTKNILSDAWCDRSHATQEKYQPNQLTPVELNRTDTLISIGLDWDFTPTHEVAKHLQASGAKSIMACYDIVPILFPEFCVRDGMSQIFKRHFVDIAHSASKVFTISEGSKRDLAQFWEKAKLETNLPSLEVVPLACHSAPNQLPSLSDKDTATLRHVLAQGEYVIYVSSFESRKNHKLLVNIWRDLYRELGDKCPQLVQVGMKGWGVDDLLTQIPRMPVYLAGKINWLPDVGDDLLLHLYKNSCFSVFPSMYEGWGLAATEAMSFGKVCLISNSSALPQATQGIMPSYHPLDYLGWKGEIKRLVNEPAYRHQLEEKISNEFKFRSWEDFSKEFCGKLLVNE